MFVCCDCCVLSGRGLCNELITRPEESYRLRCVVVCDLETSRMRRPWPAFGRSATKKKYIGEAVFCNGLMCMWTNFAVMWMHSKFLFEKGKSDFFCLFSSQVGKFLNTP